MQRFWDGLASVHGLLTNCLNCGRIICKKEGAGPCMFCGIEVEGKEQQWQQQLRRMLLREEKKTEQSRHKVNGEQRDVPGLTRSVPSNMKVGGNKNVTTENQDMWTPLGEKPPQRSTEQPPSIEEIEESNTAPFGELAPEEQEQLLQKVFETLGLTSDINNDKKRAEVRSWWEAETRKQRLLHYDQTSAQRTKLIDQSADFDIDKVKRWMSPEERIRAEKRIEKHQQRKLEEEDRRRRGVRVLHLDLVMRTV